MKTRTYKEWLSLGAVFFRVNSLTFGGGNAATNELHRELVTKRAWLTEPQFQFCYAIARLTPGANHLAFCVGAGWKLFGLSGAVLALIASSLPGAMIVVALTYLYDSWATTRISQVVTGGIVAATIGIIVATVWTLLKPFITRASWLRVLIIGGSFTAAVLFPAHPLYIIGGAALVGILWKERIID